MELATKAKVAIISFLAVCLTPSAGMFLLPAEPSAANQVLSATPRIRLTDGQFNKEVLQEVTAYVADHLAFRQKLITANAVLHAAVFHVSAEESVALGQGDWLFYRQTLANFLHTEPLSDRQLYSAARTLALLHEYAASRGAALYVTVAPNKASLYPQYLPSVGTPLDGEDDIERLCPLLEWEGVPYIDLFTPFREQEEVLYYHTDSHWNTRGAALAYDVLTAVLDREDLFFPGTYHAGETHRGDLYEMLYPAGTYQEPDTAFDRPFTYAYTKTYHSPEDQRIETETPGKDGRLLMFRDSFGNSLHPFLAESFGQALFSRSMPFQMTLLDEVNADTVLIEIVERNLKYLAERPPVFPAPERVWPDISPQEGDAAVTWSVSDDGAIPGHVRLEGTLTGSIDADSPVYVQYGTVLYEASPTGNWQGEGIPFTLYVEQSAAEQEVAILYFYGGTLYRSVAAL